MACNAAEVRPDTGLTLPYRCATFNPPCRSQTGTTLAAQGRLRNRQAGSTPRRIGAIRTCQCQED